MARLLVPILLLLILSTGCTSIVESEYEDSEPRDVRGVSVSTLGILPIEEILDRENIKVVWDTPTIIKKSLREGRFYVDSILVHRANTLKSRFLLELQSDSYDRTPRFVFHPNELPDPSGKLYQYVPARILSRWDETADGLVSKYEPEDYLRSIKTSHFFAQTDSLKIMARKVHDFNRVGINTMFYVVK
ncbi:MAG: hypothetical protein WD335_00405 [Candidatus Paceibacterota bacterium]